MAADVSRERELLVLTVSRLVTDWVEGRTTGSGASDAFRSLLELYRPDPRAVGEVLRGMRSRAPGLVRGLLALLPSEFRDAQGADVTAVPATEQVVERVVQMPEDDPLLPVIRAFDDAAYPTEALQQAHEYRRVVAGGDVAGKSRDAAGAAETGCARP